MNNFLSTAIFTIAALCATASFANTSEQKVVVDKYGRPITSIVSGECVITKWKDGSGLCVEEEASVDAPEPQKKIISTRVKKSLKTYTVSDKRSYIVFFDYNKSTLNSASKGVINKLYKASKGAKRADFELTGHADRSGSDAYNMALSKRRAVSVKEQLVRLGIPARDISVNWKGESQPLVKTNDGIKEAQNRRTEIKVFTQVDEKR